MQTRGTFPQLSDNTKRKESVLQKMQSTRTVGTPVRHKPNMAARRAAARKKAQNG